VSINGISGALRHSTNVTLVVAGGSASNTPPVLISMPTQFVNAGITLTLTNVATDTDAPTQTLQFSLLSAPANAALNTNTGVFTWRAPVALANTTNATAVKVTDNGTPPMSATNNFNVIVNPLVRPTLTVLNVTNGILTARIIGANGPDYAIQTSSNLANWTVLFTSNSPALPFDWTDTNSSPGRFYRALLGP
jgi:hypothetical protein